MRNIGSQESRVMDLSVCEFCGIAAFGDPLRDISELERVKFVMKGGVAFKKEIR